MTAAEQIRAAVYATPAPGSRLAVLAAAWLGRDAFTGAATRAPDPSLDAAVAEPARYGFHATLKAPFRLAAGADLASLERTLAAFCAARTAPVLRHLVVARVGAFVALVPAEPEAAVAALAADALAAFEPYRAPLAAAEVARRRPERLSPRQRDHLQRWGYPFVLDDFRFHMTLTGALGAAEAADVGGRIAVHFADVLERPLPLDGLGLFVEPAPGAPFRVNAFHPFGAAHAPSRATAP